MPYNIMGFQIPKRKCACGSKEMCEGYLEAASLEESKNIRQWFFQKFSE